jgi:hypothetical protein
MNKDSRGAALRVLTGNVIAGSDKSFPMKFTAYRSESLTEW